MIRFSYGRPLETLLATFGISLVLQQAARTIFSPLNKGRFNSAMDERSREINLALSITYNVVLHHRVFIAGVCRVDRGAQENHVRPANASCYAKPRRHGFQYGDSYGLG